MTLAKEELRFHITFRRLKHPIYLVKAVARPNEAGESVDIAVETMIKESATVWETVAQIRAVAEQCQRSGQAELAVWWFLVADQIDKGNFTGEDA